MTARPSPPSLAQQIEAVQWALLHAHDTGKRAHMRQGEIDELVRRLEAAAETLQTLEFGRQVLK